MNINRLRDLLHDYSREEASEEALAELFSYLKQQEGAGTDLHLLVEEAWLASNEECAPVFEPEEGAAMVAKILGRNKPAARSVLFRRKWYWAAASVLLVLGIGAAVWFDHKKNSPDNEVLAKVDVEPGREGAILILADGTQVVLDSLGNGVVAMQNGTQVILKDGLLAYDPSGKAGGSDVSYNIMRTPKGRQFSLMLPDGTKVWLNAASSLRYPTVFSGGERRVEVTGEAYFEVAKDAEKPFYVAANERAEIKVLGTHFNVNAYDDERSLNTTLLEGSVHVTDTRKDASAQPVTITPGEQARIALYGHESIKVVNADVTRVMAWRNGLFNFEDVSLDELMRQVARWYDVEIIYEKGVPDAQFGGKLSRNKPLNALIQALRDAGVHCTLEGRRLIVKNA